MSSKAARRPRANLVRTPRQARAKATVDAIVEAAARVLVERGWAGFTTNAVAARAGVSIGSLYEYFRDKDAIVAAIADRHLSAAEAAVAGAAGTAKPDTLEAIAAIVVGGFVSLHAEDPNLHRMLSTTDRLPEAARARMRALHERIVTLVAAALAPLVDEPALKARLLVDAADALTHRWFVDEAGRPAEAAWLTAALETLAVAWLRAPSRPPQST